jgi:hypothetical protein
VALQEKATLNQYYGKLQLKWDFTSFKSIIRIEKGKKKKISISFHGNSKLNIDFYESK